METNNKIIEIQNILMEQMRRLDRAEGKETLNEVQRSGALSKNSQEIIRAINTSLKIKQMSRQNRTAEIDMLKEIGLIEE